MVSDSKPQPNVQLFHSPHSSEKANEESTWAAKVRQANATEVEG